MSMDALTSAASDSLTKDVLPKLLDQLQAYSQLPAEERFADPDLAALVKEAQELLTLMAKWFGGDANAETEADADFNNIQLTGERSPADSLALEDNLDNTVVDEMVPDSGNTELNNAPAADMSDDDAYALLAAMDEPVQAEPTIETTASTPEAASDMSDDEAFALLASMDAPLDAAAPAAPNAVAAAAPETLSADDEAMRLLMSMGGMEDATPAAAATTSKVAAAPAAEHHAGDDDSGDEGAEDLQEIDEFSKNDFASDPDMMNDFISNSDDLIQTLDVEILKLEQNPEEKETIESIFRAAHTLKGAAGMFGFKSIERVMHRMENLFEQVRKGRLRPDGNTIDVVFQGMDVLRTLIEAVKNGKPSGCKTVPIVKALSLAAKGKYVKSGGGKTAAAPKAEIPEVADADHGKDGEKSLAKKKQDPQQNTIRVDLERLDHLVNLVGELVIDRTRFVSIEEEIRTLNPQMKVASNLTETVQLFGRHMTEVHEIIMKIRMVPIGNAFNKFTRIVRDLSRQLGKEIDLVIDGEETELDKTLVEQIGDPLIHLIRNSCDHGVEMPEDRRAAGKSPTGKVFLGARQEGNHIIITIEDDGKGLDVERIRRKGIERGLISEESTLSKHDIFKLIFEAGFSTAEKVTTVSGRGVGMDVVRKQISKLKGIIDLDSEPGRGTTTTIRLPLTLAIVQSLLVEVQGEIFAVPLSTVVESVRIKPEEIQRVGDTELIKRHDKVLPLMYLHETLDLAAKKDHSWYTGAGKVEDAGQNHSAVQRLLRRRERLYVVIVGSGDRRFGIVVDQLLTQQEMVIKSMGPIMRNTPCVAGGAVLGNGEVVLVLDVQELEDNFRMKNRQLQAAA